MPRLFIAIDLPPDQTAPLENLKDAALEARWTPPEQYHVTLRFLGDTEAEGVERLQEDLRQIRAASFDLSGEGLDVFPSRRRPRVLVARIEREPGLLDLQARITRHVAALGFEKDPKPFNPHVTFARLKKARARDVRAFIKQHGNVRLGPTTVREFRLYRSDLGPSGAVHTIMESYPLVDGG